MTFFISENEEIKLNANMNVKIGIMPLCGVIHTLRKGLQFSAYVQ